MIYFDNAATAGFRTYASTEIAVSIIKHLMANPGRSGHRLSLKGAEIIYNARCAIKNLFCAKSEDKVIFTQNCTHALNQAILGSISGGEVITTVFEHNSVLRPLTFLKNKGIIDLKIVEKKCNDYSTDILNAITDKTTAICITGASNVTGEIMPYEKIANAVGDKIKIILDGAQPAGHKRIDLSKNQISMLCVPAHKALNGIMGAGALILNTDEKLIPLTFGGTGTETFNLNPPDVLPERYEAGTLNLPAIASFYEGALFTDKHIDRFGPLLKEKTSFLIEELKKLDGVTVYSKPNECGIISFNLLSTDSSIVANILSEEYDVAVRGGFQCAPLMHKYLGTEKQGTIRVSLSPQNQASEINVFLYAVKCILKSLKSL
jgi:selenocysteine lyase/cysteine desulfurase